MGLDRVIRRAHRWISIVFTATVVVLLVSHAMGVQAEWVYMLPLAPLVLLLPTGLWMFFLPYAQARGGLRPSAPSHGGRCGRR